MVKGVPIEKGMTVVVPVWQLHRDPDVWDDPETFNPERFVYCVCLFNCLQFYCVL